MADLNDLESEEEQHILFRFDDSSWGVNDMRGRELPMDAGLDGWLRGPMDMI